MRTTSIGRIIDNVGALILRQIATWSLTTVLILFLPKYLGDDGFGQVTFATALVTMLLVVTNLGVGTYLVKRVAVGSDEWSDLLWNALAVRLVVSIVAFELMLPVLQITTHGELRTLLQITGVTLIVLSLARTLDFMIQALEKMRWLAVTEVANKAVTAVAGVAVLLLGYGVVAFGLVVLAGAVVALAVDSIALLGFGLKRPRFDLSLMKVLVWGGVPFLSAGAITQVYQWMDVTSLQLLTRQAVVGWYGAALQLETTLHFLPFVLVTALLPAMTRLHARRDTVGFVNMARRGMALSFLAGLPLGIGLSLMARTVIRLLGYPDAFDQSVPVLVILAVTLPISGALMIMNMIVVAMDEQAEWVKLMAVALVAGLILNFTLITGFDRWTNNGAIGAAVAALLAESFQIVLAAKLMPAGVIGRELYSQCGRALVAVAMMAGVVLGGRNLLHLPEYTLIAAGAVTYASVLLAIGGVRLSELTSLARQWLSAKGNSETPERNEMPAAPRLQTTER
ncbi:MAG TPA: flippase [Dehalococcoidia bacterium]|nr:flippase [Dehalococcoidia bacterium]